MSTDFLDTSTQDAIFDRVIVSESAITSDEMARAILDLRLSAADEARMHELAERSRKGDLTAEEQRAIDNYGFVAHCLSMLKAQARRKLKLTTRQAS